MTPVTDIELVLFHFGDELPASRRAEIRAALEQDVALSRRYALLQATLQAADLDLPPEPDHGFTERLWAGLSARMQASDSSDNAATAMPSPAVSISAARSAVRSRQRSRRPTAARWLGGALAASVLLAVGFFAGRQSPTPQELPEPMAQAVEISSGRIYQATLVRHLGATRRALLTATKEDGGLIAEGNADLARALLANNRLYMVAAERQGDHRLVRLLQEIEPVLIELANPVGDDDVQSRKGLREFVENEDLIFQVRAVEAGLNARGTTRT